MALVLHRSKGEAVVLSNGRDTIRLQVERIDATSANIAITIFGRVLVENLPVRLRFQITPNVLIKVLSVSMNTEGPSIRLLVDAPREEWQIVRAELLQQEG